MRLWRLTLGTSALANSGLASAQRLGGGETSDLSLVRVFLALLLCLFAAVFAIFLIRYKLGGKLPAVLPRLNSDRSRIRLVESRRISTQAELSLVECDGSEYLLLVAAGGSLLLNQGAARASSVEQ